jgi:hypothetical protein
VKKIILAVLFGILAVSTFAGSIGCNDTKKTEAKSSTEKKG